MTPNGTYPVHAKRIPINDSIVGGTAEDAARLFGRAAANYFEKRWARRTSNIVGNAFRARFGAPASRLPLIRL